MRCSVTIFVRNNKLCLHHHVSSSHSSLARHQRLRRLHPSTSPFTKIPLGYNDQWNRPSVGMKVSVKDVDCLIACKHLLDAGHNPVVLNLADILVPGGCVESGSGAQEESISGRRLNPRISARRSGRRPVPSFWSMSFL